MARFKEQRRLTIGTKTTEPVRVPINDPDPFYKDKNVSLYTWNKKYKVMLYVKSNSKFY